MSEYNKKWHYVMLC